MRGLEILTGRWKKKLNTSLITFVQWESETWVTGPGHGWGGTLLWLPEQHCPAMYSVLVLTLAVVHTSDADLAMKSSSSIHPDPEEKNL